MSRCIYLILCVFIYVQSHSQNLESEKLPKWSIHIEAGAVPITSLNSKTILSYQGQLGLEYQIISNVQIGVFGRTMLYHQNLDLANIDHKIIDLSSIEYNTLGITTGYKLQLSRWMFYPKLDIGYDLFLAKSLDFPEDKTQFLDYKYLSLTPKVQIGYSISEQFTLGISIGYTSQVFALKGKRLDEFNPSGILGGLSANIRVK